MNKFEVKAKNILILGGGVSGVAAAAFLRKKGALVTLADNKTKEQVDAAVLALTKVGVKLHLGSMPEQVDEFAQVVWTSFNQDLACHPKPIRDQQEVAEIVRQCL